jgi:hypothetical protein
VTVTVEADAEEAIGKQATNTGETTDTAAGVTPERFQEVLSRGAQRIDRAISRLMSAKTYEELRDRSDAAREVTFEVTSRLETVTPPAAAQEAHSAQVVALKSLATSLAKTTDSIESRSVCAAPALRARLGGLAAADDLKRARQALKSAGFDVPALLPRRVPETNRSLQNGEYVVDAGRTGGGELTIENGRVVDSVVAVLPRGETAPVFAIYVQAESSFTATGIPDGTYEVVFTQGTDWDPALGRFTRKCDFTKFDESLPYVTTPEAYRRWTISLQPVAGGSASASPTQPDEFPSVGQG